MLAVDRIAAGAHMGCASVRQVVRSGHAAGLGEVAGNVEEERKVGYEEVVGQQDLGKKRVDEGQDVANGEADRGECEEVVKEVLVGKTLEVVDRLAHLVKLEEGTTGNQVKH